jgi:hypothetical protein
MQYALNQGGKKAVTFLTLKRLWCWSYSYYYEEVSKPSHGSQPHAPPDTQVRELKAMPRSPRFETFIVCQGGFYKITLVCRHHQRLSPMLPTPTSATVTIANTANSNIHHRDHHKHRTITANDRNGTIEEREPHCKLLMMP